MTVEIKQQVNPSSFPDIKYLIDNKTITEDFLLSIGISLEKKDFQDIQFEGIILGIIDHNTNFKSHKIKKVIFLFPDSLGRHNRQVMGDDALTAYINSKGTGAKWKLKHLPLFNHLNTAKIAFEIREWDNNIFTVEAREALQSFYSLSQSTIDGNTELETHITNILIQAKKIKEAQKKLEFAQFNFAKKTQNQKSETDNPINLLQENITNCEKELYNKIELLRGLIKNLDQANEKLLCDIILTIISQAYKIDEAEGSIDIKDTIKALVTLVVKTQNNNNSNTTLKILSDFQKDAASIYNSEYYGYYQELKLENENKADHTFENFISAIKNTTETRMRKDKNIKNPSLVPDELIKHPIEELADLKKLSKQHEEDLIVHAYPHSTGGEVSKNIKDAVNHIFDKEPKRNIYNCDILGKNNHNTKQATKKQKKGNKISSLDNNQAETVDAQTETASVSSTDTETTNSSPDIETASSSSSEEESTTQKFKPRPHSDNAKELSEEVKRQKSAQSQLGKEYSTSAEQLPNLPNTTQTEELKQGSNILLQKNPQTSISTATPSPNTSGEAAPPTVSNTPATNTAQIAQLLKLPSTSKEIINNTEAANIEPVKLTLVPAKESVPPVTQEARSPSPPQNNGVSLYSEHSDTFVELAYDAVKMNNDLAKKLTMVPVPTQRRKTYIGFFKETMAFANTLMEMELQSLTDKTQEAFAGSEDTGHSPLSTSPKTGTGWSTLSTSPKTGTGSTLSTSPKTESESALSTSPK